MSETPRASWGSTLKVVLIGGTLVVVPQVPLAWFLRLWALGWLLDLSARRAGLAEPLPYPSWRHPWGHFKRGLSFWCEAFPLLLLGSYVMYSGWLNGWIHSFEKVADYRAFGPLHVISGFALLAPFFMLLPMATPHAGLRPGRRASWDLSELYTVAMALPFRYFVVLGVTGLVHFPLQALRTVHLQKFGEHLLAGWLTFALLMALKVMWSRHYLAGRLALREARGSGKWARRFVLLVGAPLTLFYGFNLVFWQFVNWTGHTEWFAHFLFLLPGAPAPLGDPAIYF